MKGPDEKPLPLKGVRVLDLTRALAGPMCTTVLADLGADVLKVEALPGGDLIRSAPPFHGGESVFFLSVNRNKRSIAIDFRKPGGLDLIRDMAKRVDVLVENFKPGVMEDMGLGYEAISSDNPRLIFASVTGFGRTGPYGAWPSVDQIAQGMSGLMSITGQEPTGPTRVGIPIGDLVAGLWIAIGVQAALIQRSSIGRGQRVETSLLAGLVGLLCVQGQRYLSLQEVPELAGNHHPVSAPYGMFQAKDGPFNISATTEDMWRRLCALLDLEELASDPRFATTTARRENRSELQRLLNAKFQSRGKQEWIDTLICIGLPAGPIYNLEETFSDPQVLHNRMVEEIEHPTIGKPAAIVVAPAARLPRRQRSAAAASAAWPALARDPDRVRLFQPSDRRVGSRSGDQAALICGPKLVCRQPNGWTCLAQRKASDAERRDRRDDERQDSRR